MDPSKEANGQTRQLEDVTSEQYSALPTSGDRAQLIPGHVPERTSASSAESGTEVSPLQMDVGKKPQQCQAEGLKVIIISAVSFSVALTVALILTIYFGPPQVPPHGAVSCDSPLCAAVGTDILMKGGSAVDAAIASTFCLAVVHPFSAGIGGGGFVIMRDVKKNHSMTINARETAPSDARDYDSSAGQTPKTAGMTVAVPGLLRGLEIAYKQHGKLPWYDLVEPAISIANVTGFNITKSFVDSLEGMTVDNTKAYPVLHQFLMQHGYMPIENDTLYNKALADSLSVIANEGVDAFYTGRLAKEIVDTVESNGGIITEDDLSGYVAMTGEPVETLFNSSVVQSVGAPAGGDIVIMILNLLEAMQKKSPNGSHSLDLHWFIETQKFSEVASGSLGDPVLDPAVLTVEHRMISKELAIMLANVTSLITHAADWYEEELSSVVEALPDRGTCTVSVLGANEDMVAISSSIGSHWGSKVMTASGIILNDQMNSFNDDIKQSPHNTFKPGKRPASYMAPSLVFSRKKPCGLRMALGGGGGRSVPAGVAQVIINALQYKETLEAAIMASRVFISLDDNQVLYEDQSDISSIGQSTIDTLKSMGHKIQSVAKVGSVVNAAAKINETVGAFGDRRNGGGESVF